MTDVIWMFAPAGNRERIEEIAAIETVDAIIPDLEDSTAYTETAKANARSVLADVADAHNDREWTFYPRINKLTSSYWRDDVDALVPLEPDGLLIPKAESITRIRTLSEYVGDREAEHGLEPNSIKLTAMFEHPSGVQNAYEIAKCDDRMERISLGTEDYNSNLRGLRDDEERYRTLRSGLDFARGKVAQEAAAAGSTAIEGSPFTIGDEEYIFRETLKLARMGYQGRAALYVDQVDPIRRGFAPSREEVTRARKLLEIIRDSDDDEQAPLEALERTKEIGNTKISHSLVGQAELVLERYEQLGAREDI